MGGMGAVYVAEQISTGRKRALKLLLPTLVENPKTRERFEQEARIASRIESDHVVEVVGAGIDPASGAPWLAMELLDGETLAARIARMGPMRPPEALEMFRQLCHALGAAHAAGLVHRDIKPENLYLAVPRREAIPFTLKILDFGIAKLTEDVRGNGGATGAVGSPLWMAPEQTGSTGVGPTADVWALGLVAFFCLTGRNYWRVANSEEATLQGLLREVLVDTLEPASVRATAFGTRHLLPPGFDAWFAHTVTREPSHRFQNAAQALNGLHPILSPLAPTLSFDTAAHPHAVMAASVSRAPSFPELGATNPNTVASLAPTRKKSSAWLFIVLGLLAVLLIGGGLVGAAAAGGALFYMSSDPATARRGPSPTATAGGMGAPIGAGSSTTDTPSSDPTAVAANGTKPSGTAAGTAGTATQNVGTPTATGTAAPTSTAISMNDVDTAPKRDYQLGWFKQKITQCWQGNEGAKPDAGSYSATITVKLGEIGQTQSVSVSPKTYKGFTGCAVVRASEHPWGRGPVETKSFSFSF